MANRIENGNNYAFLLASLKRLHNSQSTVDGRKLYAGLFDRLMPIARTLDKGDNFVVINEDDLTESIALAMRAEGIEEEKILSATTTLMDAIANNLGD